ncbi:MAG: magnesium/cobalt transporter CorA [Nitrosopumilaceae archaeon]|nr:magnesium/cobalt transporter CorA [Nitrosopumilaceae archaeon]NIU01772.1 magnesium/cobalt transporter CorA [Nitrosopumilaceae archaeon]NIU88172.1 magnesium/cobalt transporter CorA [Nitrosopumilaceae archaeon]NIV66495.1 magnesium/cobalt transporter CorA [Nitrosopumilaceae archaeon]NIX62374.1 magnesium/cobalt transporter CorA [Nitrosopumilaceae archaeon]
MHHTLGVIINRLSLGFTFAFIYQIVVGIATSLIGLPLTGNVQDLITGIEGIEEEHGFLFVLWWVISTIIITGIALIIVRYKSYLSPYKQEKDIDIPPRITPITAIIIGSVISFLFFLLDFIIGFFLSKGTTTDVQAIYQAASSGDLAPLVLSIVFSIVAGFIVVGVASKTSTVKEFTKDYDMKQIHRITRLLPKKKTSGTKTSADTAGLHPGALVHVGKKKIEETTFSIIKYNENDYDEKETASIDECFKTDEEIDYTFWINVSGIHDSKAIRKFGKYFDLHPLVQADIMNTELRPKIESSKNNIFMILKVPEFDENIGKLNVEHISLILGRNYVISFQETKDDTFDPIRERIREAVGEIRTKKSDYLCYALVDSIVDNFYTVMERVAVATEKLEEELMDNPTHLTLQTIHSLKRQFTILRKIIWPIREVVDGFERNQSTLIDQGTKTYVRDVYNHTVQVMDTIESLREMVGGMLDTYLSSVSNKMNEVMKTLTVIASIFIPITFIAGVYGTNFEYIPELGWSGSYFVMLGSMTIIASTMLLWLRKKGWL